MKHRALIQIGPLIIMICIALAFPQWGEYLWSLAFVVAILISL